MKFIITLLMLSASYCSIAQNSGNVNYQRTVRYTDNHINVSYPSSADVLVQAKGIANVKADAYMAIFSVSQVGKTTEEVNTLIDGRINTALDQIKKKPGVETLVDMISFVPVYEYEAEKKLFSKKTYNEIPAGFEVKKNIHIKFLKPGDINEIMAILSVSEIYDLVKVDYFSNHIEAIRKELMAKAKTILMEKQKTYQALLGTKLDSLEKQIIDGYQVLLPVEMYRSYQAYSSSSLSIKRGANINVADKSTTQYYQPVVDKEFDFTVNPVVFEPVIQVLYEIKIVVKRDKEPVEKKEKEYILVTPNGDLRNINLASASN